MLKLKTLKFKNIGRFVEPQEISFEKLGNLVQVDAQNNITGGSSGSGKSTVFNALDWLLGLSDLSTTILQSRLTKEGISVEGSFDWDGKEVLVHRAKKLSITIDGVETSGSSKITEELLDQIIGMSRNLFRQLLHKRQGEMGFFLAQTPAQMNSFLTDCLNLDSIRSKVDTIDQKSKTLGTAKAQAQSDLQAAQAALEATKSARASLGEEPVTVVTEAVVELCKSAFMMAHTSMELIKADHLQQRLMLEATKPKLVVNPFDKITLNALEIAHKDINDTINVVNSAERDRQANVNEQISSLKLDANNKISVLKLEHNKYVSETNAKINDFNRALQAGDENKKKAIKLDEELKELRSGICYTCQQQWVTQSAKDQEQSLLQDFDKYREIIEKLPQIALEVDALKSQLTDSVNEHNEQLGAIQLACLVKLTVLLEEVKPKEPVQLTDLKIKLAVVTERYGEEKLKEIAHNVEQNANNQKLLEVFFSDQKSMENEHQKAIGVFSKDVERTRSEYEHSVSALKSYTEAFTRYNTTLDSLKNKENEINSKVVHMNQKMVELTETLEVAEEVKRCLKSYLSCSFDDALDSVSESATRILRAVPTMANATVRLVGQKETGTGAVKDQVNALLDNDGEIDISIKSLSGGERSAVDLAVDLAVCEMIQERANKGINIMILDEPFNGFDSTGIEQALEILKIFSIDKKVLFVEHDSIAKEMVNDRITVVRDGETSYINKA